jgi:hypothetical protein
MKKPLIIIYSDGSMDRVGMSAGELMSIGRQLIAMAEQVVISGNMPNNQIPQQDNGDPVGEGIDED